MAEGLFRLKTSRHPEWTASSAGLASREGSPVSRETRNILLHRQPDLSLRNSRQVTEKMIREATDVLALTQDHLAILLHYFPSYANKMRLVTAWSNQRDIPDPIGGGGDAYRQVAQMLDLALDAMISCWEQPENRP